VVSIAARQCWLEGSDGCECIITSRYKPTFVGARLQPFSVQQTPCFTIGTINLSGQLFHSGAATPQSQIVHVQRNLYWREGIQPMGKELGAML
jgi:hypothetical protein